jgi:crossover junction endodeoxyribonuclease RuvC
MMRVIAIDPGYDRLGVALLEGSAVQQKLLHSELVETNRKDAHEQRLVQIAETLYRLCETYTPTHLAIETLIFAQNKTSALGVAEARGVVLLEAGRRNLSVIEISPQAVKIAVTGYGKSDKQAVHKMVSRLIPLPNRKIIDDEIDAIALGIAALAGQSTP